MYSGNQYFLTMCNRLGYQIEFKQFLIMEKLLNVFMKRYEYEGFDDKFKELYGNRNLFDLFLFFAPAVAWFEKEGVGLTALPASAVAKYNAVGKPTHWNVFAMNGQFSFELNESNSVLMFNDEAMTIPFLHLMYEAGFMNRLDSAANQNIDLQSTPYIIEAYDENVNTASKWSQMLSKFKSRIVLRKRRDGKQNDLAQSQVLNTGVDLKVKEFTSAYNDFLSRAYTYMGIKNVNIEKNERLLVGEISANDIVIQNNYTNCLNMRQKAFDEIKLKFGYDIKVKPANLESMLPDLNYGFSGNQNINKGGNTIENNRNKTE